MEIEKAKEALELDDSPKTFRLNSFVSLIDATTENVIRDISDADLGLIIDKISNEMNKIANLRWKGHTFIEPSEIENIKKNILTVDKRITKKGAELQKELTGFQERIFSDYRNMVSEYHSKKMDCLAQIDILESEKRQLVMKKLSQGLWPFDKKIKAYDTQIANLKLKFKRYTQKLETVEAMRPAANEKEILMFQMELKEKFAA